MRTCWYYGIAPLVRILLVVALLFTLGSCDDDEPSTRDLLIGTWEMTEVEQDGIPVDLDDYYLEVEFQRDGDYRETHIEDGIAFLYQGEWEISGNELEIDYDDGDQWEVKIVSVTADQLRVEDDDIETTFKKDK